MARCPDPKDRMERWQTFLIDGFDDWLPAATIASGALIKTTPRQVLSSMLYDFYFPEGVQQSTDDISNFLEQWAIRANATKKDQDGNVVGRMRSGITPKEPSRTTHHAATRKKRTAQKRLKQSIVVTPDASQPVKGE